MDLVSLYCVFSPLLLLPQDASTSRVKNRYIPPVQLEPNFIFMGEMISTDTAGTDGKKKHNLQEPMTIQFL